MSGYCDIIIIGDVKTMKDNRLFRILYYILEKGKVTASELADKFEVSVRTIYRDIDSISSAGIPVYALQGKGGGIEIAEDFVLSKSLLSENEKQQIMSALQGLDNTAIQHENELLTKLSALFKMKNTGWIEVDFNNWQNNKLYEQTFNDIKSAILSKNIISFTYFSSNEKETSRRVKPVRLLFKSQDWYLYAFCLLRNDFRYFKLSRIKNLDIHTEKFNDSFEDTILKKEIPHENTVHIKVKFDRKVAFRVYDEINGEIIEDNEGNVIATFQPRMNEVISETSANKMLVELQAVVNEGTARRLRFKYNLKGEIGGKTGTTNRNADAWFMGFTPELVSGCWVGGEDRDIHFDSMSMGQGATMALPIWAYFMQKVFADPRLGYTQKATFDLPEGFDPCAKDDGGMNEYGIDEVYE